MLVYFLGEDGIVPSIISVAGMMCVTSWWYSRRVHISSVNLALSEIQNETSALLRLGSAFMTSGFMTMGVAYAVRAMLLRRTGFEATGLYQAAWTLGGLYVGFILQAMGADFYPRLTASITNHAQSNRLVNEQILVGVLIAVPGVLATLTFAPLVLTALYSARFTAAAVVLRWICLGTILQVLSWPMGFIVVAKGKQRLFFISEFAWTVVAMAAAWTCTKQYGLAGAGIAFCSSYLFHGFLSYFIGHYLTGFRWSADTSKITGLSLSVTALAFAAFYTLPLAWAVSLDTVITCATGVYAIRVILGLLPVDRLPLFMRRLANVVTPIHISSASV
jgi:PST family polysaccharide transporter